MAKAVKTKQIIVNRPVKYNVEHREESVRVSVQLPKSVYEKITKDKDGNEQTVREYILDKVGYKK
jgi:hypothetical protein